MDANEYMRRGIEMCEKQDVTGRKMKCADKPVGVQKAGRDLYMASRVRWHLGWGLKEG